MKLKSIRVYPMCVWHHTLRIPMCVWHHTWVRGSNLSGGNNAIGKYAEKPQSQPALEL